MNWLSQRVGALEGRLDCIVAERNANDAVGTSMTNDMESRLLALEKSMKGVRVWKDTWTCISANRVSTEMANTHERLSRIERALKPKCEHCGQVVEPPKGPS